MSLNRMFRQSSVSTLNVRGGKAHDAGLAFILEPWLHTEEQRQLLSVKILAGMGMWLKICYVLESKSDSKLAITQLSFLFLFFF